MGCPSVVGIDIRGLLTLENNNESGGGGGGTTTELSEQETTFLYRLCKDADEVVEEYEYSVAVVTPSPTSKPTVEPTVVVTTSSPTASPTKRVVTLSPTSSPTADVVVATTPPPTVSSGGGTGTGTAACPPPYTSGQTYEANDLVSNAVYDSNNGMIPYFKCRAFPFAAWCSQPAYEPGVTNAWEQAWELMGVCDNGSGGGTGTGTGTTTTLATDPVTTVQATTVQTTITVATVATVATTPTPAPKPATTPAPSPVTPSIPTKKPTKQPTITNPEETPASGSLPVQFQYEIGNNSNLQSQSIVSESNPKNDMVDYLESGTDSFVKVIMDAMFGGGAASSSSAVSAAQKESSLRMNDDENVRRRRRHLQVSYNTTSVSIENIQDISCSFQNMTTESRCQKVTAGVTLELVNEPPLTTRLRFQIGISQGIEGGMLSFPPESGIVYVGETKSVQVFPELGAKAPDNGGGGSGGNNGSTFDWVVPVSVTVAAAVAAILILFAGSRFKKRQRERKEFDGAADQVSLEEGNDFENDLSPNYPTYPPKSKRHMNIFEETIEDTPQFKDDDSDLIDLEQGGTTVNMTMKSSEELRTNPFALDTSHSSSSSSGSYEMSPQQMQQPQTINKAFPLPSWKEVSEEDLSKSGEVGEIYMRERDSTDYRAGVEALVAQACPEHLVSVDDMMSEYQGREPVLIGQLSVMLAAQKRNERTLSEKMSIHDSRLKSVLESGAALRDSKSYDESSAAGSSQWSTDDGMSSIDASMSFSSSERDIGPDTYAVIGEAAMTIADSNKTTTFIKVDKNPDDEFHGLDLPGEGEEMSREKVVTRDDLDAAIEAGDWTAVGATASLLSSKTLDRQDSNQSSIRSEGERSESVSLSSMDYSDKDRAFEFERLIEAGDWKAVMAIASEFEGAGESDSLHVSKLSELEYDDSGGMNSSESFERKNEALTKHQEIEELVRRVVPDEIENIDEMLLQFKGRENELITTLQTMEERNLNSPKSSNSSISSPESKASSAESPTTEPLRQMPSFHEETVFESDSVFNESDYYSDRKRMSSSSSKSKSSSSNKSSDIESSSSSEDLSTFVHK